MALTLCNNSSIARDELAIQVRGEENLILFLVRSQTEITVFFLLSISETKIYCRYIYVYYISKGLTSLARMCCARHMSVEGVPRV